VARRPCKNFPPMSFDHQAKFGCYVWTNGSVPKIWGRWHLSLWHRPKNICLFPRCVTTLRQMVSLQALSRGIPKIGSAGAHPWNGVVPDPHKNTPPTSGGARIAPQIPQYGGAKGQWGPLLLGKRNCSTRPYQQ